MSDLISRSALLKEIRERAGMWKQTAEVFCKVIEGQPTVEAVPVVHGEWIKDGSWAKCSVCGEVIAYRDKSNFCKECGADMRKKV